MLLLSLPPSIVVIAILAIISLYVWQKTPLRSKLTDKINSIIQKYNAMPGPINRIALRSTLHMLGSNWYSLAVPIILWLLLFQTDVGKDIIEIYIDNIEKAGPDFGFGLIFSSLSYLFACVFLMTLSIWIIPFFLLSTESRRKIKTNYISFYFSTKLLAILAIVPFYVIASAFLKLGSLSQIKQWHVLVINIGLIVIFLVIELRIAQNTATKKRNLITILTGWIDQLLTPQTYRNTVSKILFVQVLLTSITAVGICLLGNFTNFLIAAFVYISSSVVFKLLFFTDERKLSYSELQEKVLLMIGDKNKKENKALYIFMLSLILLTNIVYYTAASLSDTNTLYVLLVSFSTLIVIIDFMRYLSFTDRPIYRLIGRVGLIALVASFLVPSKEQFSIPLLPYQYVGSGRFISQKSLINDLDSNSKIRSSRLLENALLRRIAEIDAKDSTGHIYIVCGMGGGSRAGYFTARVLEQIDKNYPSLWRNTLCYSTVSGSSVGLYHYLRQKTAGASNPDFLTRIYEKNYNTSGVYGLFIGDPFESLFGGWAGWAKSIISDTFPPTGFYDRNFRIRMEYEQALKEAFPSVRSIEDHTPEGFQAFYEHWNARVPLHFINTFEVNSGRRAVLSPFITKDTSFFSNAMLPLQDRNFDKDIAQRDINYRDAVNLSELFPFVSAASSIGISSNAQFVDGGYFENYGLATTIDVIHFLQNYPKIRDRLTVILIKNSLQDSKLSSKKSLQLAAPLVGVINAPFTGHANQLEVDAEKTLGDSLIVLEFDSRSDSTSVSLTRALTSNHIKILDSMAKNVVSNCAKLNVSMRQNNNRP